MRYITADFSISANERLTSLPMDPHHEEEAAHADMTHMPSNMLSMAAGMDLSQLNVNHTDFNSAMNLAKQLELLKAQVR